MLCLSPAVSQSPLDPRAKTDDRRIRSLAETGDVAQLTHAPTTTWRSAGTEAFAPSCIVDLAISHMKIRWIKSETRFNYSTLPTIVQKEKERVIRKQYINNSLTL